jgi:hypothetical protein
MVAAGAVNMTFFFIFIIVAMVASRAVDVTVGMVMRMIVAVAVIMIVIVIAVRAVDMTLAVAGVEQAVIRCIAHQAIGGHGARPHQAAFDPVEFLGHVRSLLLPVRADGVR